MYGQMPFMMPNIASDISAASNITKTSLFSKINWSSLLSNTQKILNVANQAIPLYYQVKPVMNNIRALGKIGREFNKTSSNNIVTNNTNITPDDNINTRYNGPTPKFFL